MALLIARLILYIPNSWILIYDKLINNCLDNTSEMRIKGGLSQTFTENLLKWEYGIYNQLNMMIWW